MRMKEMMVNHVDRHRQKMFNSACEHVTEILKSIARALGDEINNDIQSIYKKIEQDYMTALVARPDHTLVISEAENSLRELMSLHLKDYDLVFGKIKGLEDLEGVCGGTATPDLDVAGFEPLEHHVVKLE
jgi:hypothetical protein